MNKNKTKTKQQTNKQTNRQRVKLMWIWGFYMWHLSLTTKLSEFRKCNIVIFSELWKVNLGPFRNKIFIYRLVLCMHETATACTKCNMLFF